MFLLRICDFFFLHTKFLLKYTYHNTEFFLTDLEETIKTPDCSSGPVKEERGDLIKFYNTIYVGRVKSFALKYDLSNQDHMVHFKFYYFIIST